MTQPAPAGSVDKKILRAFTLQLVLISGVTVLGVLATNWIVQDLLSQEALTQEAEYFWSQYAQDPQFPLPNTANLQSYFRPSAQAPQASTRTFPPVPPELAALPVGFGRAQLGQASPLVYVSDHRSDNGARLYLVFAQAKVADLSFYFGLIPLVFVLMSIYLLAFLTYRSSHRAISPFLALANHLEAFTFRRGTHIELDGFRVAGNTEVNSLVDAVSHLAEGWEQALERERVFTRDAGHELRTPLAVFKGSIDLLEHTGERSDKDREALARMRKTAADMETLLNTLLLLAREPGEVTQESAQSLNAVVHGQVASVQSAIANRPVQVRVVESAQVEVAAPEQVLQILVGNLLRNAVNYTPAGEVELHICDAQLRVVDSGVGMSSEEVSHVFNAFFRGEQGRQSAPGHGLGLAIVKRITDRYGWTVRVSSEPNVGTEFTLNFAS